MNKSKNKFLLYFSFIYFSVCIVFSIIGTFSDLNISLALFSPRSKFAVNFEAFGQCVLWFIWGPIFSVLFVTRHSLQEYVQIFSNFLPFIKPIKNTDTNAYKIMNKVVNLFTVVIFFVLCVIGWKKPIQNILKHMFDIDGIVYFIISAAFSALGIFILSGIGKDKLKKFEAIAATGLFFGICLKFAEELKPITQRVRFREMVAYSNSILDVNGLSHGSFTKLSPVLQKEMANNTDFSAFTRWYRIGDSLGKYAKADSFPSGHVMNSCAVFLSYILFKANEKLNKFAPFVLMFSAFYVSVMGLSRIVAGAHYLTDVTFAMMIGYCIFLIAYKAYDYGEKKI